MISAAPATISGMLMPSPMRMSAKLFRRRRRDRDDVVEAHDDVGDRDDPHRAPQMFDRLDAVVVLVFRHQQLAAM